ncbi:MAG: hypothetical protein ACXWEY_05030 [Bacteroidia bacterium]
MKTILKEKKLRRTFLITISILLILIILIRAFILPSYDQTIITLAGKTIITKDPIWLTIITRLLDSLFVSLTVTVAIGLFLSYIEIPEEEKKFEIIESFKISELFEKERNNTEIWYFSGGTGRYTRAKTVPELSRLSKNSNQHKTLKIQIIDPTNEATCHNYAIYRSSLKSSDKNIEQWTKEYVRQEVTATIILIMLYKSANSLLDLSICLKNNFSTLRIDLSSHAGIVTKEDSKEPALACRENSFLYRTYKEEILQTFKEYKSLNTNLNFNYRIDKITDENISDMCSQLGIEKGLTKEDFTKVAALVKENKNPYA